MKLLAKCDEDVDWGSVCQGSRDSVVQAGYSIMCKFALQRGGLDICNTLGNDVQLFSFLVLHEVVRQVLVSNLLAFCDRAQAIISRQHTRAVGKGTIRAHDSPVLFSS